MINNLFLSVGAMKAGTTWLYENLKNHSEISFTPEKEIHYFANKDGIENQLDHRNRILKLRDVIRKLSDGNPKFIAENLSLLSWYLEYAKPSQTSNDWYTSLFEEVNENIYCADFSNLYCQMSDEGWNNVYRTASNVKVIYTLRDPEKRLWSHYKFHHKWIGKENDVLDDGFDLFKETLTKSWFINNVDYSGNYKKLLRGVKHGDVKLLYFEDFRADPQSEINKVCDFLNISRIKINLQSGAKKVNSTKDIPMPKDWEIYAKKILAPYKSEMKELGIYHNAWGDVNVIEE